MSDDLLLSESDQKRVEAAVAAAENRTSGEIVPYVVARSGVYPEATWKGAGMFGAVACLIIFAMGYVYDGWAFGWLFSADGALSVVLFSAFIGGLLARFVPTIERHLTTESSRSASVVRRSAQAFLEEEVFSTRERTGILLFVSLFEHRVEVVGDTHINESVEPEDWAHVVADVLHGIKAGSLADGLVKAIDRCGDLLEQKAVTIRDDDTDELSNRVRLRPE